MSKYFIPAIIIFILAIGAYGCYKATSEKVGAKQQEVTVVTDENGEVVAAASSVSEEPVVEEVKPEAQPEEAPAKPIEEESTSDEVK